MKSTVWLKLGGRKKYSGWVLSTASAFKKKPTTHSNELAIQVELDIPDSYFEMPEIRAVVTLPSIADKAGIQARVEKNISQALTEQLGVRVHLTHELDQ